MKKILEKIFNEKKIEINNEKIEKFDEFFNFLTKTNEKMNLTRIISPEDVAKKHFLDSIFCEKYIPKNSTVIDVGAGGGFPSIPLKIYRPDLKITMLDSVGKKVDFLNSSAKLLSLENCIGIHERVEDYARTEAREGFDVCVSRAVASLNTLLEYCAPLVKVGGLIIAFKGENANVEIDEAKNAISKLSVKLEENISYSVSEGITSHLLIFKKEGRTPNQFPRRNNLPRKQPL